MNLYLNERKNDIFCVIGRNVKFYRSAYNLTHPHENITQAKLAEMVGWIVNTFLDNFYKDNPKRYATGVW